MAESDSETKGYEMMIKKTALYGVLIALAMILSFVESLIPVSFGIVGAKLGLANLVTIVVLYLLGAKGAFTVSLFRILLVGITFGNLFSLLYSFSGGILSLVCMILVQKTGMFSCTGVSIVGGVTHNLGQIIAAVFVVHTAAILTYFPVLMIAGIITGMVIGIIAALVIKRIRPALNKERL